MFVSYVADSKKHLEPVYENDIIEDVEINGIDDVEKIEMFLQNKHDHHKVTLLTWKFL